ncbi:MAG: protein-disulfide reductase DsbD [Gammaproteobacteria bacterium]|nr:protein-disulfide reductase DsbD [Gammaproteobacteria bacterium]
MKTLHRLFALTLLVCLGAALPAVAQDDELLPPEEAFALRAWIDGDSLVAEYSIAPGYYMYRERFDFQVEQSDLPARFDVASIPPGKVKQDEFFGEVETYRNRVRIELPLLFDGPRATQMAVKAVSQGCADIGVCYPPLKQSLQVQLASTETILPTAWTPADAGDSPADPGVAALQALLNEVTDNLAQQEQAKTSQSVEPAAEEDPLLALQQLGEDIGLGGDDDIPHPDQAFVLSARLDANNVIQSNILLGEGIYLYREKIRISMAGGEGHAVGAISLPRGKQKNDEFLGLTEVIYGAVDVSIPILSEDGASSRFALAYEYQGCLEERICYPPIVKYLSVDAANGLLQVVDDLALAGAATATGVAAAPAASAADPASGQPLSEQESFAQLLRDANLMLIIGLFFIAGVGLTFTPCVFPMIPILSSIIAGQGENITTGKAFTLSLVYVLTMAFTYAAAGAIVGFYGAEFNIQIWFQDPIILSGFALVFVLLALSMFGFYELQLPNALQSRLTAVSNSQQGGTLIGVGIMGFLSAIIVGPCITAPLVGALIFISQTQDWLLGGLALFALGLGMGVPLMLVGTSAGKLLPRAGGWMDTVKAFFGIVLLGVAIWLLERILPIGITMLLVAALLIASAIYMGALDSLGESPSGWRKFGKSMGLLILLYGVAYLVGAAAGSKDLLQPLRGLAASTGSTQGEQHLAFRQIKGEQGLQVALNDASRQGQNTMLDFYADWCVECKVMEKYTFTHPAVLQALDGVAALQADVTENDAADSGLMSSLGIYGPPAIMFFDRNGNEIRHRRVVGEMSGEDFAAHVAATFQ